MKIKRGREMTIPTGLLMGTAWAIAVTLAGGGILSFLIVRGTIAETAIGYSAMGIILTAAILGASRAMASTDQKPVIISILAGIVYYAVLIGANALFCKGEYEGLGVTGFLILGGALAALFMKIRPKKTRHSRVRKIRPR